MCSLAAHLPYGDRLDPQKNHCSCAAIPAGIQWKGDSKLCDLDFADDIALLADSKENIRKITSELSNQAIALGLQFNVKKTKLMKVQKNICGEGYKY